MTCSTTERISHRYTKPTGSSRMGRSRPKARAHTMPPMNREPVSPMNTLAGCQFHRRNPTQAAAEANPRADRPAMESMPAHRARLKKAKKETVVFSPSMPSVKLTALVTPTMTMAARG